MIAVLLLIITLGNSTVQDLEGVAGPPGCSGAPFDPELEQEIQRQRGFSSHQTDMRLGCDPGGVFANKTLPDNITINDLMELVCRHTDVALIDCIDWEAKK